MTSSARPSWLERHIVAPAMDVWRYCTHDIWHVQDPGPGVKALRTLNLSVSAFLSRDIQTQAYSMAYQTILAIVPVLALLVGVAGVLSWDVDIRRQLVTYFPAQREAIDFALSFVQRYLTATTEDIFVGLGIAFLVWTLVLLIWNVEDAFNLVWGAPTRSLWHKVLDYTGILLVLPVLMLLAGTLSLLVTDTATRLVTLPWLTPLVGLGIKGATVAATWLAFTLAYKLIPNTHVPWRNAAVGGILAGTAFLVLQWIFVTGQLYVARYNAIFGSFSFLPLMMIWLQLAWVVCLSGAVVAYASQHVYTLPLHRDDHAIKQPSKPSIASSESTSNPNPKPSKFTTVMKQPLVTNAAPGAIGPYSQAIDAGALVFASGQLPIDPLTGAMPQGVEAQTQQSIDNVVAVLAAAGLTLDHVVKTTVYLSDMALFGAMNQVYAANFRAPFPARSAVAVRELPKQALVEIEVIAAR